jgi:metal iron transporter
MIALVPATIVAAVVGKDGINALLVASQFILSLVLPFTVLPLVWLTSNERIMSVPIPEYARAPGEAPTNSMSQIEKSVNIEKGIGNPPPHSSSKSLRSYFPKFFPRLSSTPQIPPSQDGPLMKNFANSRSMKILGYVIFICILAADTIAIISLGKGS